MEQEPQEIPQMPVAAPAPWNNTSGQGKGAVVPPEIKRWNWGAFFWNWIWGLGNQTYIALIGLIPFVNIVFAFFLGAKGSEWAWQSRHWESIEEFKKTQRKWAWAALIAVVAGIALAILAIVAAIKFTNPPVVAAEAFFDELSANDNNGAYAMTSQEYQSGASIDDFNTFLSDNPILTDVSDASFPERDITNASATLMGTITASDGSTSTVTIDETKEEGSWKIDDIILPNATDTPANEAVDNTQSVVNVICDDGSGGSGSIYTTGGVVLTNNHVIAGAKSCLVTIPDPSTGEAAEIYKAVPVIIPTFSKQYDIAMLQIDGSYTDASGTTWGSYPTTFPAFVSPDACTGSAVNLGEALKIYGYPVSSGGYNLTVTQGIVSSFADDGTILTDAKIDSGNSGGLAVDSNGCFVGIPSAVQIGNYDNLGVIIPWNIIQNFFDDTNNQSTTDQ